MIRVKGPERTHLRPGISNWNDTAHRLHVVPPSTHSSRSIFSPRYAPGIRGAWPSWAKPHR